MSATNYERDDEMEQRLLSNEETEKVGFAVGTYIELFNRLLKGDANFTLEQYEQIVKAIEILSEYDEAELLELINTGLYWGLN